ncbi:MAG: squalene--hopene cyclase [Sphingomonadales bacterium]|jgi:squalene-hopene/tetraprenyl-beta-curcumene cyclase
MSFESVDTANLNAGTGPAMPPDLLGQVEAKIEAASKGLQGRQMEDGHWLFELEADATIPAEYIFLMHYLDEIDEELEKDLAKYLRRIQEDHGGWPLFHKGDADISATVKAYYALKLVGDDVDAPHMQKARAVILSMGGAERANVFTRYALALFDQIPWRGVPVMPVELMLMPNWFPVHMGKLSYWSRTVVAPLLVLAALKPKAKNPRNVHIRELFQTAPEDVNDWHHNPTGKWAGDFFLGLDKVLRVVEPFFPKTSRKKAIDKAFEFFTERLNGEDGLGAIFPAMANAVMAMEAVGYSKDHPDLVVAKASLKKLIAERDGEKYVQPCLSPVWDTSLSAHAMLETADELGEQSAAKACDWLLEREITDVKGDWSWMAPDLDPGGWAFQYNNDHYPDVDDTAVVGMALHRTGDPKYKAAIDRAEKWIIGMQSSNGGWGAFDIDNDADILNSIPFADHGALLDPPTADVSARCLSFLAQLGHGMDHAAVKRGVDYLRSEQEEDGSWFGRWGTNYIYGTWSVLSALNAVGVPKDDPMVSRAVAYLLKFQQADGGWGEDGGTYWQERVGEVKESTPSQTAWALLGLMAAGEVDHPAVEKGVSYLLKGEPKDGKWDEEWFTAVGFPRVFYLRYHGYSAFFPLWALSRYRNLKRGNSKDVQWGM